MYDLWDLYYKDLYRYIFSITSDHSYTEEVLQETFMAAHLHRQKIQQDKEKNWLLVVSKRKALNCLKEDKIRKHILPENHILNNKASLEIENTYQLHVTELLKGLSESDRDLMILKYVYGYKESELALRFNKSTGTIKSRLHRIKKKILINQERNLL